MKIESIAGYIYVSEYAINRIEEVYLNTEEERLHEKLLEDKKEFNNEEISLWKI